MSGNSRIISGQIAHSKSKGKAFIREIGQLVNETDAGATKYGKKK